MIEPSTRAELARTILLFDAIATTAKDYASEARKTLTAQARDEYESQGTAPTWRIPDVGTVSLAVSHASVAVEDEKALMEWVQANYPSEVETVIRPAFRQLLTKRLVAGEDGTAVDPQTGEVVPGVTVHPGGQPRSVSVRPDPTAKALIENAVRVRVEALTADGGDPAQIEGVA